MRARHRPASGPQPAAWSPPPCRPSVVAAPPKRFPINTDPPDRPTLRLMTRKPDRADAPKVGSQKKSAVGIPGIAHSLQYALAEMGPVRAAKTLLHMNHVDGFDCPSCAWPDPDRRKAAEFCENGAKAVAWEATRKR